MTSWAFSSSFFLVLCGYYGTAVHAFVAPAQPIVNCHGAFSTTTCHDTTSSDISPPPPTPASKVRILNDAAAVGDAVRHWVQEAAEAAIAADATNPLAYLQAGTAAMGLGASGTSLVFL